MLLVGLAQGLAYVFLMPPWQHYDEPNHFEYAWLVANRQTLPSPGDSDPTMNRAVLQSMKVNDFYRGVGPKPDLRVPEATASLGGYSQLDEPPLYYLAAAVPLYLLRGSNAAVQLYAGRLVSLAFFLVVLAAAWGTVRLLTRPGSPLRWLVPLTLALLPGFLDGMTGMNNDSAAVAVFSLALWGSVRLAAKGFSLPVFLLTGAVAALAYFTKSTALLALPVFAVGLLFSLLRGRWRGLAWRLLLAGVLLGLLSVLEWGDASFWYRATSQAGFTRVADEAAPHGDYILAMDSSAEVTPRWLAPLFQPLPLETSRSLQGKPVTLGVWMWASQPVDAFTPSLNDGRQSFSQAVFLTQEPAFYAFHAQMDPGTQRLWMSVDTRRAPEGVTIYFDGFVLVEGERPRQEQPVFAGSRGMQGEWGGQPFTNLLRNPSMESAGLRLRPWADDLGVRLLPDQSRPSLLLASAFDRPGAGWIYRLSAERMLRTFWGLFGWAHVPYLGHKPYRVFAAVTLALVAGAAWGLLRRRSRLSGELALLLGLALALPWAAALVRGMIYLAIPHVYLPVARYAFPAAIPTAMLLALGGWEILRLPWRGKARGGRLAGLAYLALFAALDVYAFASLMRYYY